MNINKSIRTLVKKECCCFDKSSNGITNYCDKEPEVSENKCAYFFKAKKPVEKGKKFIKIYARCSWFERAILPLNPQLEALYKERGNKLTKEKEKIIKEKSPVAGKIKVHCKRCEKTFLANSYRARYCERCKRLISQEKNRKDNIRRNKLG